MDTLRCTMQMLRKRPGVIIIFSIVLLAYQVVGYYNPIPAILYGLNTITRGNMLESVVSYLQILMDPKIIPIMIAAILAFSIVVSLAMGLFLSGYFYCINNTITGKKKTKGEFMEGLKGYFSRILTISLRVTIFGFAFIIFMMVSAIPAVVITRAAFTGRSDLILAAIFVNILTIGVIFFGMMFFRAYMFFWYPAAINCDKSFFVIAKRVVDRCFWDIVRTFVAFDVVFIGFEYAMLRIGRSPGTLVINWVFKTIFFLLYINFIFFTYRKTEKSVLRNRG